MQLWGKLERTRIAEQKVYYVMRQSKSTAESKNAQPDGISPTHALIVMLAKVPD
jgi:hypothetical protein